MKAGRFLSVADFERAARRRLPAAVFGFVSGGAEEGRSLRESEAVFERIGFRPRGLTGVAQRTQTVALWDRTYSMPVGIAPTGIAAMCRHRCDLLLARAAAAEQVPFIISGSSSVPLERLQQEAPGCWYQGYFPGDRERIDRIAGRLEAAAIDVLVVTIDTPVAANRENNERLQFTIPFRLTPRLVLDGLLHPVWSADVFLRTLFSDGVPRFANLYEEIGPPITAEPAQGFRTGRDLLTWEHMAWLRDRWRGRLLLKGVMHPGDAEQAVECGMDGVIVSNHGGRQLDGTIAPLQALPAVVSSVPADFPVMIDGGFRRGSDVLKALALGARMVFVGRPTLYGAAVAGEAGVRKVLSIFRAEIDRNLALLGCSRADALGREVLERCGPPSLDTR